MKLKKILCRGVTGWPSCCATHGLIVASVGFFLGYLVRHFNGTGCNLISNLATTGTKVKHPLLVSPLLKELGCGWGNMQIPPVLFKNAKDSGALLVDIGLDDGNEFFFAVERGFECVGFEPNPVKFAVLAKKCNNISTCEVRDAHSSLPLVRQKGISYLINVALGRSVGEIEFFSRGAASTAVIPVDMRGSSDILKVPVRRLDEFIQEDVYLLKIDAQGFDHFILEGARNLFMNNNVRQLIFEVEPLSMARNDIHISETIEYLNGLGLLCFTDRNDLNDKCKYFGNTVHGFEEIYFSGVNIPKDSSSLWAECWEDFICINTVKEWNRPILTSWSLQNDI